MAGLRPVHDSLGFVDGRSRCGTCAPDNRHEHAHRRASHRPSPTAAPLSLGRPAPSGSAPNAQSASRALPVGCRGTRPDSAFGSRSDTVPLGTRYSPARDRTAVMRYLTVRRYPHRSAPRSRRSGAATDRMICARPRLASRAPTIRAFGAVNDPASRGAGRATDPPIGAGGPVWVWLAVALPTRNKARSRTRAAAGHSTVVRGLD